MIMTIGQAKYYICQLEMEIANSISTPNLLIWVETNCLPLHLIPGQQIGAKAKCWQIKKIATKICYIHMSFTQIQKPSHTRQFPKSFNFYFFSLWSETKFQHLDFQKIRLFVRGWSSNCWFWIILWNSMMSMKRILHKAK